MSNSAILIDLNCVLGSSFSHISQTMEEGKEGTINEGIIRDDGTFPCFALGAQITSPSYFDFKKKCFRFVLILAPAEGFNQTSFLTLQGILHGAPTLRGK